MAGPEVITELLLSTCEAVLGRGEEGLSVESVLLGPEEITECLVSTCEAVLGRSFFIGSSVAFLKADVGRFPLLQLLIVGDFFNLDITVGRIVSG